MINPPEITKIVESGTIECPKCDNAEANYEKVTHFHKGISEGYFVKMYCDNCGFVIFDHICQDI